MSTTHRPGDGSGYYPSGDVLARQHEGEVAAGSGWSSGYYPQEAARNWAGGGEMGGAAGAQNSPYPGYDPSDWSCAGQPRPPYPPTYTVSGQGMEHYTNGSYGQQYNQSTMNPPYPGLHPANPYYPPPSQPHYPVDPYKPAMHQGAPPQAPSHWGYPQQGCHNIPQQRPPFPQYPPPQGPRDDSWNMYGAPNHYQWHSSPPQNPNGPQYMPGGRPPWPGGDVQSPVYDVKDSPQNPGYNHQRPYPGYPSDIPPCPPSEPKPSLPPPNPHYSASPQMYNRKEPSNPEPPPRSKEANNAPADPSGAAHPGILKINQVLDRVVDLEREVDEFVGRKTDMSYRCLEELLTKELLELDSVETGGQDGVRQSRKEAVKKLQSILERLEKKGL